MKRRIVAVVLISCGVLLGASWNDVARADDWTSVWKDGFEDGNLDGWEVQCFSRHDTVALRPDPSKCDPGNMLFASSPGDRSNEGAGYRVSSPRLVDLGVDELRPYRVRFDYLLPANREACWTYALASRAATLVVKAAQPGLGTAMLGWVDDRHLDFHPLATLELGRRYHFDLLATPHPDRHTCEFSLKIDGREVGGGERSDCVAYDRIVLLDLPAVPYDVQAEMPDVRACFGSGFWDDFEVVAYTATDPPSDRGVEVGIYPSPFNPRTEVHFRVDEAGRVRVAVYDVAGRLVRRLSDEVRDAGLHRVSWEGVDETGRAVASGSYFVHVRTPSREVMARAVLVR